MSYQPNYVYMGSAAASDSDVPHDTLAALQRICDAQKATSQHAARQADAHERIATADERTADANERTAAAMKRVATAMEHLTRAYASKAKQADRNDTEYNE